MPFPLLNSMCQPQTRITREHRETTSSLVTHKGRSYASSEVVCTALRSKPKHTVLQTDGSRGTEGSCLGILPFVPHRTQCGTCRRNPTCDLQRRPFEPRRSPLLWRSRGISHFLSRMCMLRIGCRKFARHPQRNNSNALDALFLNSNHTIAAIASLDRSSLQRHFGPLIGFESRLRLIFVRRR